MSLISCHHWRLSWSLETFMSLKSTMIIVDLYDHWRLWSLETYMITVDFYDYCRFLWSFGDFNYHWSLKDFYNHWRPLWSLPWHSFMIILAFHQWFFMSIFLCFSYIHKWTASPWCGAHRPPHWSIQKQWCKRSRKTQKNTSGGKPRQHLHRT